VSTALKLAPRPQPMSRVARPIAALPALSPRMLIPSREPTRLAFPFGDTRTQFFYLGRGAVWHAARLLQLRDEEVLVPAYHHGVEVEALLDAGVRPRFYGVKRSFHADLASIAQQLTPKTKALYVIHYAGFPQPMDDLLAFARARGLKVIEDCALSLLSSDGTRPLGARGDAAIFCLYKSLPVPHGGALWMPHHIGRLPLEPASLLNTAHQLASSMLVRLENGGGSIGPLVRSGVRAAARMLRSVRPLPVDSRPVGSRRFAKGQENLAISPLTLRVAEQLDLTQIVEQRRRNYYALMARLRHISPPMVHELEAGVCPLFYPFWCDDKRRVQARLAQAGVESIDFWSAGSPLVKPGQFPDVDALRAHVLELPIHQDLQLCDIEALASAVRQAMREDEQA
jgi:perosamine synthetase